jgi:hypothetical protein
LAPQAAVLPVAIQYAFAENSTPAAWVDIGAPAPVEDVEAAVETGLARIDSALIGNASAFPLLVQAKKRRPEQGLGARLLARIRG